MVIIDFLILSWHKPYVVMSTYEGNVFVFVFVFGLFFLLKGPDQKISNLIIISALEDNC